MSRFIHVKSGELNIMINIDHVVAVIPEEDGCAVHIANRDPLKVDHEYEEISVAMRSLTDVVLEDMNE